MLRLERVAVGAPVPPTALLLEGSGPSSLHGLQVGRIEVDIDAKKGKSEGIIYLPSSLDKVETAILAAALCAFTSTAYAAHRRRTENRRAWILMTISMAIWSAGMAVWTYYGQALNHEYPFPSIADAGFIGYFLHAGACHSFCGKNFSCRSYYFLVSTFIVFLFNHVV